MARPANSQKISLKIDELLRLSPWFTALDRPAQERVEVSISERPVAQGAMLGHQGEIQHAWYGMLEGLMKWSSIAYDGRSVTLGCLLAGSWFGEGTLIRHAPRQSNLVALRASRIAQIPLSTFQWLRETQPSFNDFLVNQLNERLHWFMGNSTAHALLSTDGQVVRALLGMVNSLPNPRGERRLKLTQKELADIAAVSRQTCNSTLMKLKAAGYIRTQPGGITVIDVEGLEEFTG
ncbi:CRP-like cAMP-binding protein OS=Castellaniella defragrans OX=75697 GN=HNR28_000014 PE=4 SV=1 [Castellaniella defragrans]